MTGAAKVSDPSAKHRTTLVDAKFPMKPFEEFICGDNRTSQPLPQLPIDHQYEATQTSILYFFEFAERVAYPPPFNEALLTYLKNVTALSADVSTTSKVRKLPSLTYKSHLY